MKIKLFKKYRFLFFKKMTIIVEDSFQIFKNEWLDKDEWSNADKKWLMNMIHQMTKYEQIEIFLILQKDSIKYTENQNGIFINIQTLKKSTLNQLGRFVNYAYQQRNYLEETEKKMKMKNEFIQQTPHLHTQNIEEHLNSNLINDLEINDLEINDSEINDLEINDLEINDLQINDLQPTDLQLNDLQSSDLQINNNLPPILNLLSSENNDEDETLNKKNVEDQLQIKEENMVLPGNVNIKFSGFKAKILKNSKVANKKKQ